MTSKNKVSVNIHGVEYKLVSDEPKEFIYRVASYVDNKMDELSGANAKLSVSMIAVLTALNIADDLFKLKESHMSAPPEATNALNAPPDQNQPEVANTEQNDALVMRYQQSQQALQNCRREIASLKSKLHVLSYELEAKQSELTASQQEIDSLTQTLDELTAPNN